MNEPIKCPKCDCTQLYAGKKGFSETSALIGEIISKPMGVLLGSAGAEKVIITCLNCGHSWRPRRRVKPPRKSPSQVEYRVGRVGMIVVGSISLFLSVVTGITACYEHR